MWIEIVDAGGKTIGAVNSECCDLIRINKRSDEGALIRCTTEQPPEIYQTRISYLRLIETLTQSEAQGLKQIADIVADAKDTAEDAQRPRLILP